MHHPRLILDNFVAMDGQSRWNPSACAFDIKTPHALSQISGYAKYCLAQEGNVYFRGQSEHHDSMRPSLFRGVKTSATCDARTRQLSDFIKESSSNQDIFITNTPSYSKEAILQHYGFKTRWLDMVDNIWSALWFACHKAICTGKNDQYVNFENNESKYCFVYLLQFGHTISTKAHGYTTTSKDMSVIDLRIAAPSLYLRPHSQHGLLARRRCLTDEGIDYSDCIVLALRIRTLCALKWIGNSPLSDTNFMFPPPSVDQGYKIFLEKNIMPPNPLGCIQFIGA